MPQQQAVVEERKFPQQARSRALVDAILDATVRILVEEGFARTTTSRVAERAGVSVGSLYQYFPSRESLVAAVARRHSEHLKTALERDLEAKHANLKSAIDAMLASVMKAHSISPELTAVLAEQVPKLGSLDWRKENSLRGVAIAAALLNQHAGELRDDIDKPLAALVCSTCVEGVVNTAARLAPERIVDGSIVAELGSMLTGYLRS